MAAVWMDGKALAGDIKARVRLRTGEMVQKPGLAVVLVGEDPAALAYERGKERDCQECGIRFARFHLPREASQAELLNTLDELGGREDVDGILLLLPLPGHLDQRGALLAIPADKDVDCLSPVNLGELLLGGESFAPCTPAGVMALLAAYGVQTAGKRCVVVGRSSIVGKPQALLMLRADSTVTICHTRTAGLAAHCREADILITAAGRPGLITGDMVKEGAVVVDVSMNRGPDGKLCGDVVLEEAALRAGCLTPVPGGTGPVTRAVLMEHTLEAALRRGKT